MNKIRPLIALVLAASLLFSRWRGSKTSWRQRIGTAARRYAQTPFVLLGVVPPTLSSVLFLPIVRQNPWIHDLATKAWAIALLASVIGVLMSAGFLFEHWRLKQSNSIARERDAA